MGKQDGNAHTITNLKHQRVYHGKLSHGKSHGIKGIPWGIPSPMGFHPMGRQHSHVGNRMGMRRENTFKI